MDVLFLALALNDAGMVTSMIYPDGAEHSFAYDNVLGRLASISEKSLSDLTANSVVTGLTYTNSGVVTDMTYVNGVTQHWDFDNRKRISKINISTATGVLEELNYTLNKNGDILTINENEYKYDGFNRIIGAKTLLPTSGNDPSKLVKESFGTYQNNAPLVVDDKSIEYNPLADLNQAGSDGKINGLDHIAASFVEQGSIYDIESFTYDKNGNRTSLTQNGDIYTYIYAERNRLTSVLLKKKGTNSAVTFITYQYDDNGNLTKRDIHRDSGLETVLFKYDTMNRLIETTEPSNTTKYFYDNAGNRFIKSSSDGSATLYLRHGQIAVAMDIEIPKTGSDYKGKINRYILSGDLVAGRVTETTNNDNTKAVTKSYYHLDHLNSTKLVTDETAAIEANYTYRAFGEQLNDLQTKDAKYTYGGKELDTNTNLYYFNARFYDPTIGRFINVDPIQDGTNWYVYCSNNPLNFRDPTGLIKIGSFDTKEKFLTSKELRELGSKHVGKFLEKTGKFMSEKREQANNWINHHQDNYQQYENPFKTDNPASTIGKMYLRGVSDLLQGAANITSGLTFGSLKITQEVVAGDRAPFNTALMDFLPHQIDEHIESNKSSISHAVKQQARNIESDFGPLGIIDKVSNGYDTFFHERKEGTQVTINDDFEVTKK